jgi:hypothetical protein
MANEINNNYLEPRVAKLETGLEILTRDVSSLAGIVRDQGRNIEGEIQKLAVAVTQAGAPKKTDWATLISLAFLIIALGSAVFYPLNSQVQEIKEREAVFQSSVTHTAERQETLMNRELELVTLRIDARLNKLESNDVDRNKADLEELRLIKSEILKSHMGKLVQETK